MSVNSYIGKVQIGNGNEAVIGSTLYGTCPITPAATAQKSIEIAGFTNAINGVTIHVRFVNGNSVKNNVTLQINTLSEVPVVGNCVCNANDVVAFTFHQEVVQPNDTEVSAWYANTNIVVEEGSVNGQIKINGDAVSVHGLGNAAYTDASAYATAAQGALAETAAQLSGATFTGPVAVAANPTTDLGVATKQYVDTQISSVMGDIASGMVYKGTIGSALETIPPTITALPGSGYKVGDTYRVVTAGTYITDVECEIGDLIIAIANGPATGSTVIADDWTVAQTNIEGAVSGPDSATVSHVAIFSNANGKVIEDSGLTIGTSVPQGAVFTDTTYTLTQGQAYTNHSISVDNDATVLANVASGVLTLAPGIKFVTSAVNTSITASVAGPNASP